MAAPAFEVSVEIRIKLPVPSPIGDDPVNRRFAEYEARCDALKRVLTSCGAWNVRDDYGSIVATFSDVVGAAELLTMLAQESGAATRDERLRTIRAALAQP